MDHAAPIDANALIAGENPASAPGASADDLSWAVVQMRAGARIIVNEPLIAAYQAASSPHTIRALKSDIEAFDRWCRRTNRIALSASPDAKRSISDHPGHPALLGNASSLGFGVSRGGAMIYRPDEVVDGIYPIGALTQWFEKTGEFWGIANEFLFTSKSGRLTIATGYIFNQWVSFLKRNCALALAHGGALPIHVRLGVTGLDGSWWPAGRFDFDDDGFAAVEPSFEYDATLTSIDKDTLRATAVAAFNALAAVYGIEPHNFAQIEALGR